MFEDSQPGIRHEALQLIQIFAPPLRSQARCDAERVRAHRVVRWSAGRPTGTELIAAQHNALGLTVVSQFLHLRLVLLVTALDVEAAAEGKDHYLETHFG